jgi:hypothetical protein
MGWLPHFLNAWPAAIAAAVAIPSLLILYFLKLRRREMAVPSTLLWRKAIQDLQVNSPFQKLRKNLLLFLQLLLLLLLLLALARPVLNYTPGAGARTIILIDRSASMSSTDMPKGKTRLDEAKKRAKDLVATMGRNASAMVIAFDEGAEIIQAFTGDTRVLDNAIDTIQLTDRKTKLDQAYRMADAQAAFDPGLGQGNRTTPTDIWLYSDGRAADADSASVHGTVHYDQIGLETATNIAVVAMNAKRNYEVPTQVQVFARLASFGPDPVRDVQVQLSVDGEIRSAGTVNLLPDRYNEEQRRSAMAGGFVAKDSIEFPPLELTSSAVIKVEQMSKEGDCLPADDAASVVVPPPKILSVLLVSDGNFFLEQGLRAQKLKIYDKMFPQEFSALPAADDGGKKLPKPYDVIVFDRYDLKADEVPRTGAAVYFGCVPPGIELKAAVDTNGDRVVMKDNYVLDWDREHPILRHLNLGKLYAADAFKLLPTLNSSVLVDGTNGPLMVMHRQGRAIHLIVPFDLIDSNWPLRPMFPVFLYQTLQFMSLGTDMDVRPSYSPGVALRIPRFNLQKLEPSPETIMLNGPMGPTKVKVPLTGDFVLPALNKVGVYSTDPPIPQYENIAVSLLDANESNVDPAPVGPGSMGTAKPVAATKTRLELWWWLVAAAALPLLMIEWWVYTRRVHL